MPDTELPLREIDQPRRPMPPGAEDEIRRLVERFYELGREDDVLGVVFERAVDDWDHHFDTMNRFWTSAVYRTGTYSGRPIEVHRRVGGIEGEHFRRWLALWERTVDEVVRSDARDELIRLGIRMAQSMGPRLGIPAEELGASA